MKSKIQTAKPFVRVVQQHRTKWHTNSVSGHSWPEHTLIKKWDVKTEMGTIQTFNSESKAESFAESLRWPCKEYDEDCETMTAEQIHTCHANPREGDDCCGYCVPQRRMN